MGPSSGLLHWAWIIFLWVPIVIASPAPYHPLLLNVDPGPYNASTTSPIHSALGPNVSLVRDTEFFRWRIPDSHIVLHMYLDTDKPIAKFAMGRTILRTQQRVRDIIKRQSAEDEPIAPGQNPYESDKKYEGCFFGAASWPVGSRLLTYGMVDEVLQGLWLFMYRGERFIQAVFEIKTDQFGTVGIGKLQPDPIEGPRHARTRGKVVGL